MADAPHNRLIIARPRLPFWLDLVQVKNLRVGNATVNLRFVRQGDATVVYSEANSGIQVDILESLDARPV